MNYWDLLMETDEAASDYMTTYGEGVGSDTRHMLESFINDGESLLDVGCGPGHNFQHFNDFGPQLSAYKGTDYSERFIRVCKLKYPDGNWEVQDARKLTEPDKSWDVVLLQDIVEHTNGYEKPFTEALRVARKRIIVTFWHLTENDDHINDDGNDGYGAWYTKSGWESYLDKQDLLWFHVETPEDANRHHDYYIIELGEA